MTEHNWYYRKFVWKGKFGKVFENTGGALSAEVREQEIENFKKWIKKNNLKLISIEKYDGIATTTN
jgi:hypothetical protein